MTSIPEYERGKRDAIRWAVNWLHKQAALMNDPHAKAILNTAAFHMGTAGKETPATPIEV